MLRVLLPILLLLYATASAQDQQAHETSAVPVINGDLGPCSAVFNVKSTKLKPIYNARVSIELRSGFGGFRRTELEIYTNMDGTARVEGLPNDNDIPLVFDVEYEGRATAVVVNTAQQCQGSYPAIITDKVMENDESD